MRIKKENLKVFGVVTCILLATLILILANLTQDTYSVACTTCKGTGLCPGTPVKEGTEKTGITCPKCKKLTLKVNKYSCKTCGLYNYTRKCTNTECGYNWSALGELDAHGSQPCPTCHGSKTNKSGGVHKCLYGNGTQCKGTPVASTPLYSQSCPKCEKNTATYKEYKCSLCQFWSVRISCSECNLNDGTTDSDHSNVPCTMCRGTEEHLDSKRTYKDQGDRLSFYIL